MKIERCEMPSFAVIGLEGSTNDGEGFIASLWERANAAFGEVASLAERDDQGNLCGIWGAMSDFSRSFHPGEEKFTKGLYLAGVQCPLDAQPPAGWSKWVIPAYEYLYVCCDEKNVFSKTIDYMQRNGIALAGAANDFICPQTGKSFMFFPIRKL